MDEEKEEEKFLKQNYKIIKKYSKQLLKIDLNNKIFSQIVYKNIFENLNENEFHNKIIFLIYSFIRQIEYLILSTSNQETNIFNSIKNNEFNKVKFFIENGYYSIYDVNDQGKSVLSYCLECGNKNIYEYLLSKQTDDFKPIKHKPKDFEPNIFKACQKGKFTSVQWLIEKEKVNVYQKEYSNTLLHVASESDKLHIVKYLIEKQNVDINIKGNDEMTPLHFACSESNLSIVEYLISKGADIEAKDYLDKTPLHYACQKGHLKIVEYLVSKGANIEAKAILELTPLYLASSYHREDVIKYLKTLSNEKINNAVY